MLAHGVCLTFTQLTVFCAIDPGDDQFYRTGHTVEQMVLKRTSTRLRMILIPFPWSSNLREALLLPENLPGNSMLQSHFVSSRRTRFYGHCCSFRSPTKRLSCVFSFASSRGRVNDAYALHRLPLYPSFLVSHCVFFRCCHCGSVDDVSSSCPPHPTSTWNVVLSRANFLL